MSFLKKLFGGTGSKDPDPGGIYVYVRAKRAPDAISKVRIDKQYDLNRSESGGYVWHKTIVDNKYFSRVQAVIHFDAGYNIVTNELTGGELISAAEYEAVIAARNAPPETDTADDADGNTGDTSDTAADD